MSVFFLDMWDKLFNNQTSRPNKALQSSNISLDQTIKMLIPLNIFLQEMRNNGAEQLIKTQAINICENMGITSKFKQIKKKISLEK